MTVSQLQDKVTLWSSCEDTIAKQQEFRIGDKQFTFADLGAVSKTLKMYEGRLIRAEKRVAGKKFSRTMQVVFDG